MEQNLQRQKYIAQKKVAMQIEPLPFQAREAINVLRGNIQLSGYDVKTIAVTSALKHEGKSSVAFRLAQSMAGLEKKTLYLDCDIRNSATLSRYHVEQKVVGLSEFLCRQAAIQDVLYRTDDEHMDVLFTGAVAPNPSELFSGEIFEKLLRFLRMKYDYVIVDTPPVNPVIDGVLIAKQCDGTVLVVNSGNSERAQVIRARQQLEYAGIKMLGAVLNMSGGNGKYGYGRYGYGYGYGYGKEAEKEKKSQKQE
jgi:capsular exopolysaccharide synthesis family protein